MQLRTTERRIKGHLRPRKINLCKFHGISDEEERREKDMTAARAKKERERMGERRVTLMQEKREKNYYGRHISISFLSNLRENLIPNFWHPFQALFFFFGKRTGRCGKSTWGPPNLEIFTTFHPFLG